MVCWARLIVVTLCELAALGFSIWENVSCEYDTPSQSGVAHTTHNIK